jgi:hypothetical protein
MRLRGIGWGGMDWIDVVQDRNLGDLKPLHTLNPIFLMSTSLREAPHTSHSRYLEAE